MELFLLQAKGPGVVSSLSVSLVSHILSQQWPEEQNRERVCVCVCMCVEKVQGSKENE